jgi:hypothetical protein
MDEESVFAAAVKIESDSEREALPAEARKGNSQLREQVDELFRAHAAAGSFLNHPPVDREPGTDAESEPEATVETVASHLSLSFLEPCGKPDRLGKLGVYEVIEVVGQGGMGIVLRACDTKLNRTVAVKVMAPELAADAMAVKRFLSEAQKAAAIVHDHVVTIHAVDDTHRPPFLVMEYIEGQTLQQKIDREGALPLIPILRIGTQIAEGLAAAHIGFGRGIGQTLSGRPAEGRTGQDAVPSPGCPCRKQRRRWVFLAQLLTVTGLTPGRGFTAKSRTPAEAENSSEAVRRPERKTRIVL